MSIKQFTTSCNSIPKCIDCKNYIKHTDNGKVYIGLGKCNINGYNLKSGPVWFYANSCRNSDVYCGEKGKFFKK